MNMIQQSCVINDQAKRTGFNGLMLNEQKALGQLCTHSKGKVMQQNDYKAQWKIT